MKRTIILVVVTVIAFSAYSQHANSLVASTAGADRLSLAKSSINLPTWHEKSFWPIYENYLSKAEELSSASYRALEGLAKTNKAASPEEANENANNVLAKRRELLDLRKQYYNEIQSTLNGIIALQFLQTEVLLDMMESSQIYEQTGWKNYRFHPNLAEMTPIQFKSAKQNIIRKALSLDTENSHKFWISYNQYEEECDALLGEDYSMISMYAGEASDFTPVIARRLGQDFIIVMEREIKLKEKYYKQMNTTVGSSLAARFLAWEDYYSLINKMYAWADAP